MEKIVSIYCAARASNRRYPRPAQAHRKRIPPAWEFSKTARTDNCRNMYGPPPNCKKNRLRREQSAKMYPASKWRVISGRTMMIRTCLSLIIPSVVKTSLRHRFSGTSFDCVFVVPIFCRLLRKEFSIPLRLVGEHGRLVQGLIVVSFRQNRPADPGQFVGRRDNHDIACGSGLQPAHPLPQTRPFAFDA